MIMNNTLLPDLLIEKLTAQYGPEITERIICGFRSCRKTSLRVNTLKSDAEEIEGILTKEGITYHSVSWSREAFVLPEADAELIEKLPCYQEGKVYLQSLSSMLPPLFLGAEPGECVLDMAAAPGGKTTQIAALAGGKVQITACEMNKIRAERLKFNLERQGVSNAAVMVTDARRLDDCFRFDRILLDAPCTGTGTIELGEKSCSFRMTSGYLQKTVRTQEALLQKALRILKKGHEMIYSTCSVLADENEDLIRRNLSSAGAEIVPLNSVPSEIPLLPVKLPGCVCVCPTEEYEGFFVAKLRKK